MKKDKVDIFAKIAGREAWICLGTISKTKDAVWSPLLFTTKDFVEIKAQIRKPVV